MSKSYLRGRQIVRLMTMAFAALAMVGVYAAAAQAGLLACPTTITKCGCTIKTPGTYHVGNNIQSTSTSATCINIKSPATLDGDGFFITGTGIFGPGATTAAGITVTSGGEAGPLVIEDLNVEFFQVGIKVLANNVTISDCGLFNNSTVGVLLDKSDGDTINDGTDSEKNVVAGYEILKSNSNTITDSFGDSNGVAGAWITNSSFFNTITNSEFDKNGATGIIESCSPSPKGFSTTCHNPLIPNSAKATITNNDVDNNGIAGIAMDFGNTGNTINNNSAFNNAFVPVLGVKDLVDFNKACDNDAWSSNSFGTANQGCIH